MATRSSSLVALILAGLAAMSAVPRQLAQAPAPPRSGASQPTGQLSADAHTVGTSLERTGFELVSEYLAAGGLPTSGARCGRKVTLAHSVIAILPDPLDSHLDWAFDSGLESIRRAMENSRYVLDRYWLPWTLDTDTVHRASDHLGISLRTRAPGVLLFRSSDAPRDSIALVYLVGETPTRGIHTAAFRAAAADRELVLLCRDSVRLRQTIASAFANPRLAGEIDSALTSEPKILRSTLDSLRKSVRSTDSAGGSRFEDTLRIVGPVFSGSARSLRDALEGWHHEWPRRRALVISGGATAASNQQVLSGCQQALHWSAGQAPCTPGFITFHATVNTVTALKMQVEGLLRVNLGVLPGEIAYLNESGTLFGQALRQPSQQTSGPKVPVQKDSVLNTRPDTLPLQIPFPMNISRLRREYTRRPSANDTMLAGTASRTRLEWKDPASASETPSPLSELSAAIMERTISDIEQTLRIHRVKAVGILATDVRDRLFLASIVRERLRDVKLFLIGSHALYLRPEINEHLRGTIVVSTYPLFLESQFWDLTQNEDRQRLVFTSDIAEGTYNAMLYQVGKASYMIDYGYPLQSGGASYPPVWITVVGATSQLPLIAAGGTTDMPIEPGYVVQRPGKVARQQAELVDHDWDDVIIFVATILGIALLFSTQLANTAARMAEITRRARGIRRVADDASKLPVEVAGAVAPVPADAVPSEADLMWTRHGAELLLHRRSWTIFRFAAVVCALTPLVLILARPQMHGDERSLVTSMLLLIILGVTIAAGIVGLWHGRTERDEEEEPIPARDIAMRYGKRASQARLSEPMPLPSPRKSSVRHPISTQSEHVSLIVLAILYVAAMAWFIVNVVTLQPAVAAMFFMRALHLSSGVTPVVPLIVGGVILVIWSTWHLKRVELLGDVSAFEVACVESEIDAERISRPHQPRVRRARDRARVPGTRNNFKHSVESVRRGLLSLVPAGSARFTLLALGLFGFWVAIRFQRSMESALLGFSAVSALPAAQALASLTRHSVPSAFDVLFRFLLFAALGLSAWGLYRLVIVWGALRKCLLNIEAMPLGNAFDRLPPAVADLLRFTPVGAASRSTVHLTLDRAAQALWLELKGAQYDPPISAPRERSLRFRGLRSENGAFDYRVARPLIAMHDELCQAARSGDPRFFASPVRHDGSPTQSRETRPRDKYHMVQEMLALYVIDYVEWVIRHLRHLALNLVVALALATILLSSYPFEPETLLKVFLFFLMGLTVAIVMTTLVQMNRNPTLSRMTRTLEGQVTWDRQLVFNLLLVGGVPLVTVMGSEFPQAREFLFFWVTPVLRALGKS